MSKMATRKPAWPAMHAAPRRMKYTDNKPMPTAKRHVKQTVSMNKSMLFVVSRNVPVKMHISKKSHITEVKVKLVSFYKRRPKIPIKIPRPIRIAPQPFLVSTNQTEKGYTANSGHICSEVSED